MRMTGRRGLLLSSILAAMPAARTTRAQEPEAAETDGVEKAREEYKRGVALTQEAKWGEALTAFERSAALRKHSLTTYNIGACERALGRHTRARAMLRASLAQNEASGGSELSETYATQANIYLAEIEKLLVHVDVDLTPLDAAITVDGRPLAVESSKPLVLVAGVLPAGPGAPPPARTFELLLDPGAHVFALARKGFQDVAITRSFAPTVRETLRLQLDKLPARIQIDVDQPNAVVTLGGLDVGVAPTEVTRPAGSYELVVRKVGWIAYRSQVSVNAGEAVSLKVHMERETTAITQRWWFWTAASVVVLGAATATYFVTRPAPERPAPNGGTLGWVVTP